MPNPYQTPLDMLMSSSDPMQQLAGSDLGMQTGPGRGNALVQNEYEGMPERYGEFTPLDLAIMFGLEQPMDIDIGEAQLQQQPQVDIGEAQFMPNVEIGEAKLR